jgi:hypothetical protein
MEDDELAPEENVRALRQGLAEYFHADSYLRCESMGALVRENLRQVRAEDRQIRAPGFASR